MKALSIKQPWASLIAHGIKDIENRTWKTHFRGRIFIHASAKDDGSVLNLLNSEQFEEWDKYINTLNKVPEKPISAIIGEVDIIDCVINHTSIWAEYTSGYEDQGKFIPNQKPIYNWVLANPVIYEKPILNVRGNLSFWKYDIHKCHCCGKTSGETEIFECERCEEQMCSHCQAPYNQFSQVDYNLCTDCYND